MLIETSGGTVERRLSRNGGDTWETPVTAKSTPAGGSLADLTAEVQSMSYDPRTGGSLYALVKQGGTMKVLHSTTLGKEWVEVA